LDNFNLENRMRDFRYFSAERNHNNLAVLSASQSTDKHQHSRVIKPIIKYSSSEHRRETQSPRVDNEQHSPSIRDKESVDDRSPGMNSIIAIEDQIERDFLKKKEASRDLVYLPEKSLDIKLSSQNL